MYQESHRYSISLQGTKGRSVNGRITHRNDFIIGQLAEVFFFCMVLIDALRAGLDIIFFNLFRNECVCAHIPGVAIEGKRSGVISE